MSNSAFDPVVQRLREEISELDASILDAVNARLELVAALRRHKDAVGLPVVDPDRERQLLDDLARANRGPLSDEGLRALFCELLDVTMREVAGDGGPPDA
jgi:chorismate mutase/prephenate dehydratase